MTPEEMEIESLNLLLNDDPDKVKEVYSIIGAGIHIVLDEVVPCITDETTLDDFIFALEFLAQRFKDIGAL